MNDPVRIPYSRPCFFGGGGNGGVISLDFPPPKKKPFKIKQRCTTLGDIHPKKKTPVGNSRGSIRTRRGECRISSFKKKTQVA